MKATLAAWATRYPDRLPRLLAALFFGVLALVYYLPSLNWLPRGIHEWAQADRLALAISFYDNGMHFFRPQTLNLSAIDGVVGPEFPLTAWLAALLAKLTGRGTIVPWFHLLNIAAAVVGCYFLFRLVYERSRNFAAALLPGIFLATSPVFAYYTGNFLPDPVGASLVVVGTYFLLRFGQQPRLPDLLRALLLLTLATLIKTSAGIYLVAAIGLVALWSYLRPAVLPTTARKLLFLLLSAGSLGVVVAYARYNKYLNEAYHSIVFLAEARPIETQQQYDDVLGRIRDLWWQEYFTPAHYLVLQVSAVLCLLSLRKIVRTEWLWASLLALAIVGGGAFFWLMGRQFFDHDYYVLAPYWPGLVLLVALAAVQLATWSGWPARVPAGSRALRAVGYTVPAVAALVLLGLGLPQYRARTSVPYRDFSNYYSYPWMIGGAADLAAARVPPDATLLTVGEVAPNLSLVYFDRRGIVWNPEVSQVTPDAIRAQLTANGLGYVLIPQAVYGRLPAKLTGFRPVVQNERYVLLQPENL